MLVASTTALGKSGAVCSVSLPVARVDSRLGTEDVPAGPVPAVARRTRTRVTASSCWWWVVPLEGYLWWWVVPLEGYLWWWVVPLEGATRKYYLPEV